MKQLLDVAQGVPICGFTGVNGAGKTLLAVQSAIADMSRGRAVYSTVQIKSPYGESIPIRSLRQLLAIRDATVLLDDISAIFSARTTQALPPEVVTMLHSLRHSHITVRWTAPQWIRADTNIRGITQALVNVVPFWRYRVPGDPWPAARLVMAGLLDTSTGKADGQPTGVLRRRLYVPKRLEAFGAYDTYADTPQLGSHTLVGVCVDCGGAQERPKHTKQRHEQMGLPWFDDAAGVASGSPAAVPAS